MCRIIIIPFHRPGSCQGVHCSGSCLVVFPGKLPAVSVRLNLSCENFLRRGGQSTRLGWGFDGIFPCKCLLQVLSRAWQKSCRTRSIMRVNVFPECPWAIAQKIRLMMRTIILLSTPIPPTKVTRKTSSTLGGGALFVAPELFAANQKTAFFPPKNMT